MLAFKFVRVAAQGLEFAARITMLTSVHDVWDNRIYHREAKSLVRAGYHVTIIATGISTQSTNDKINIVGLRRPRWRVGRAFNWLSFIRTAQGTRADLFHFHDPDLLVPAAILRFLTKKPVIYDNHDPYVEAILTRKYLPYWSRSIISRTFALVEKVLAKTLSAMIVANDDQQVRFPQSILIRNYPDLTQFVHALERPRLSSTVVYAGTLTTARGLFDVIEIATLLVSRRPHVKFTILGPLPNSRVEREINELIEQRHLRGNITFEGRVPYDRVRAALSESAIGLIPFQNLPVHAIVIPTKLFEYMASALPIVASDLPPIRKYMSGTNCGLLVHPVCTLGFVEAIEYLIDRPDEAREMAQNGYSAVRTKHSWVTEEQKLVALYGELLGTAPGSAVYGC